MCGVPHIVVDPLLVEWSQKFAESQIDLKINSFLLSYRFLTWPLVPRHWQEIIRRTKWTRGPSVPSFSRASKENMHISTLT